MLIGENLLHYHHAGQSAASSELLPFSAFFLSNTRVLLKWYKISPKKENKGAGISCPSPSAFFTPHKF